MVYVRLGTKIKMNTIYGAFDGMMAVSALLENTLSTWTKLDGHVMKNLTSPSPKFHEFPFF